MLSEAKHLAEPPSNIVEMLPCGQRDNGCYGVNHCLVERQHRMSMIVITIHAVGAKQLHPSVGVASIYNHWLLIAVESIYACNCVAPTNIDESHRSYIATTRHRRLA